MLIRLLLIRLLLFNGVTGSASVKYKLDYGMT